MNDSNYDYETPVQETPGYLGLIWDDFIEFEEGLKPLENFEFKEYAALAEDVDVYERQLDIDFGDGSKVISFNAYSIHEIVASIPFVAANYDCPPDQGPASGSGYIFILDHDHTIAETAAAAKILRLVLDADLLSLRKISEGLSS
jgi:hypothetical protein